MKEINLGEVLCSLSPTASIDRGPFGNRFANIAGQRFGRLVALVPTTIRNRGNIEWLCQCSCGKHCLVTAKRLRSSHTRSCGCLRKDVMREVAIHTGRTLPPGVAAFNGLLGRYKQSATSRSHKWELADSQFRKLTRMDCWYCGAEPAQIWQGTTETTGSYIYNGVDRIDNTKGYTPENVVPCCEICNRAKKNMGYDEFVDWITRLRNTRPMIFDVGLLELEDEDVSNS